MIVEICVIKLTNNKKKHFEANKNLNPNISLVYLNTGSYLNYNGLNSLIDRSYYEFLFLS